MGLALRFAGRPLLFRKLVGLDGGCTLDGIADLQNAIREELGFGEPVVVPDRGATFFATVGMPFTLHPEAQFHEVQLRKLKDIRSKFPLVER